MFTPPPLKLNVIGDDGGDSDGDDMRRKKETYIMSSMLEPGGNLNTGGDS